MASLVKRGGRWTATARVPESFKGPVAARSIAATFRTKAEASLWADSTESSMRLGTWTDPRLEERKSSGRWEDRPLRDTLERYQLQVTPTKKGEAQETTLLDRWMKHDLASRPMRTITRSDVAAYRDERVAAKKAPSTIKNEINTLSAVFSYARTDWGYDVENPVRDLTSRRRGAMPKGRPGRDRRLLDGEQERLERALLAGGDGQDMLALWRVLLDTGMRLGEAESLTAGAVRKGDRSLMLAETKNGSAREVLLSDRAWADLSAHAEGLDDAEVLFPGRGTIDFRWKLARKAAKVKGFRIHDLRHEALSRMAARGVDIKTMMAQSGHKTPAMLLRYLNPTREERRRALFGESSPPPDAASNPASVKADPGAETSAS